MRMVNRIKFKFTAGVFVIVTAVTVMLGLVSYEYEKRAVENRLYAQLNAVADLEKERVVSYLNERKNDLKNLATAGTAEEYLSALLDPRSGSRSKKNAHEYLHRRLAAFKEIHPEYLRLALADQHGAVLVSSDSDNEQGGMVNSRQEHRSSLAKAFKQGDTVIFQDDIGNGRLEIAVGMGDGRGSVRAVLIGSVSLADTLFPLFTDYTGLGNTGETLLMKRKGSAVSNISPTRYRPPSMEGYSVFGEKYRKLAILATSGNEGIGQGIDYRGKSVIGAYRSIPGLDWGLVTKIDTDEAYAGITALRQRVFLLALVTLAVMLAAAYVVGRKLASPITELIEKTKSITAGRFSALVKSGRTDEIGELEENFNQMVLALDSARLQAGLKHEELEKKVNERTDNLARANAALSRALEDIQRESEEKKSLQAQLLHAQKMEAIGTLAGGIAHDFNNILTAIIGYGNVMRMKMKDDDPQREHLDHILAASERAASLTHSLLAFSRKQIINPRPVNLNGIVGRVQKLLTRLMGEDIELRIKLCKEDPTVLADSGQIEQVLMNLATNARDAMPGGGLFTVSTEIANIDEHYVSLHGYGDAGTYAVISVSDTGCGMDDETRARIFEPFFTTKETGKGTGLGLSIVYGIVKAQKGYINCYSEPGKGTTFKIYLPLTRAAADKQDDEKSGQPQGGRETILVAEDSDEVRGLAMTILTEFGYTVIEAGDGENAVKKFKEHPDAVNLLLMDIIMPRMNGKEAYEEIKKMRPDIKVIFTSGYTADIIRQRGFLGEGLILLTKPLSPRGLLLTIRQVLDGTPSAEASVPGPSDSGCRT